MIGLIGEGQEIHVGEEAGLIQWRHAVEKSNLGGKWMVHGPASVQDIFAGCAVAFKSSRALNLDTEIRFHLAKNLHLFVDSLLKNCSATYNRALASQLEAEGYHLRITRDLEVAKSYLRERYAENPEARYGLVASSKDRDLPRFGVMNDYQSTKRIRFGPWYSDDEHAPGGYSCRYLRDAVTEFGAQGLELDAVLLAWGTDLIQKSGRWSNERARGYQRRAHIRDPHRLRLNAYRVLLTRGRDATVAFVPRLRELDETWEYLSECGFRSLDGSISMGALP